jgi:hypothetical protein
MDRLRRGAEQANLGNAVAGLEALSARLLMSGSPADQVVADGLAALTKAFAQKVRVNTQANASQNDLFHS